MLFKKFGGLFASACLSLSLSFSPLLAETNTATPVAAQLGQEITLDPSGGIGNLPQEHMRLQWRLDERPSTSVATLSDPSVLRPNITVDVAGRYVAVLEFFANDDVDGTTPLATTRVEFGTENLSPVSRIIARTVPNDLLSLTLDGSNSFDVEGDTLSYQWMISEQPSISSSTIGSPTSPMTTIQMDAVGTYVFSLNVTDSAGNQSTASSYEVVITAQNSQQPPSDRNVAPTANFTFEQLEAQPAETIVVDSHKSTDLDGDALISDFWTSIVASNLPVDLTVDGDARGYFSADADGEYLITMSVSDGQNESQDHLLVSIGEQENLRPVAKIINGLGLNSAGEMALDATQSYDFDGDLLSYSWSLLSVPEGSLSELSMTGSPLSSFTPDITGSYVVQLDVNDGTSHSEPVTYIYQHSNSLPIADAGVDIIADSSGTTQLKDVSGFDDVYWSIVGLTSNGSDATLQLLENGVHQTTLGVFSGNFKDVVKHSPVYHLKAVQSGKKNSGGSSYIRVGGTDGQCMFDVRTPGSFAETSSTEAIDFTLHLRGSLINLFGTSYVWEIENKNYHTRELELTTAQGTVVGTYTIPGKTSLSIAIAEEGAPRGYVDGQEILSDDTKGNGNNTFSRNTPVCSLANETGTSSTVLQLVVRNENGTSLPDTIYIGSGNIRPVVNLSGMITVEGLQDVVLTGEDFGFDADNDILDYTWSLLYHPKNSDKTILSGSMEKIVNQDVLEFTPDLSGLYLIQLTAKDAELDAVPAVIVVEVLNTAPTAVATGDSEKFVGELATFDGTGSFDAENDALTYAWELISAPSDSVAVLSNADQPITTFTPDRRGDYTFALTVSDYEFTSEQTYLTLTAPNREPVAVLDANVEGDIDLGNQIEFSALGSSDPDADPLTYEWTVASAPTGSVANLIDIVDGNVSFVPDFEGAYAIELIVSDGLLESQQTYTFSALPKNFPPVLGGYEAEYFMEVGEHLAVNLTATDPDAEDTLSFYAIDLPLPVGMVMDAQTGALTFDPETGQEGDYNLVFGVSDGIKTSTANVIIHVLPADAADTTIAGRVLNADDFQNGIETPIGGIPVRLDGAALETITAPDGTFTFTALAGADDIIFVEPSASGGPGGYTSTSRSVVITQNQEKVLKRDFLISPLDGICVTVNASAETVLNDPNLGVNVSIPAGTIKTTSGSNYTGEVCLGELPRNINLPSIPDNTNACQIYSIDAPGATFTQGLTVSAPNLDNLPGGANADLWRLYGGFGRFLTANQGTVASDGNTVSASAANFNTGTLFTFLPQSPSVTLADDQADGKYMLSLFDGDLSQSYSPVSYQAFGQNQTLGINYHSTSADPRPILAANVTVNETAGLPVSMSTVISLGGNEIGGSAAWNPRLGADGATPAPLGEEVTLYQSTAVDATGYTTGRYGYNFTAKANYDCSTVAADVEGKMFVRNDSQSPIGAGWTPDVERIYPGEDGSVTIVDDAEIVTFDPEPGLNEIQDTLSFPIKFGGVSTIWDVDGNGFLDVVVTERDEGRMRVLYNFGDRNFQLSDGIIIAQPFRGTNNEFPDLTTMSSGQIGPNAAGGVLVGTQWTRKLQGLSFTDYDVVETFFEYEEQFSFLEEQFGASETADFNNDGIPDIVFAYSNKFLQTLFHYIYIGYGQADGTFQLEEIYEEFTGTNLGGQKTKNTHIAIADINGDGSVEFVARSGRGLLAFVNDGSGTLSQQGGRFGGSGPFLTYGNYVNSGDFDNDGIEDIIFSNDSSLTVYYGSEDLTDFATSSAAKTVYPLPAGFTAKGLVWSYDYNGDGRTDVGYSRSGKFVFFANSGTREVPIGEVAELGNIYAGTVGDLDGDENLDLVAVNTNSIDLTFFKSETSSLVAPPGEFSTLTALESGGWERRYKDGTVSIFDSEGYQISENDPEGNQIKYDYDAEGRLISVTDQVGKITVWSYSAEGYLESITDPMGRVTQFSLRDTSLEEIQQPDTTKVTFSYDADGRLVSSLNERGAETSYGYDLNGKLETVQYPTGLSVRNQIADNYGLSGGLGGAPINPDGTLNYVAPEDRRNIVTDQRGNDTEILVNRFGSPVQIVDQLGRLTTFERDDQNMIVRIEKQSDATLAELGIDPNTLPLPLLSSTYSSTGIRTDVMTYDENGNVLTLTEGVGSPSERTMSYKYEPEFNNVTEYTDGDGFKTLYEFNEFGKVIKITDPEGGVATATYYPNGMLASKTDQNGNTTTYAYDDVQNLSAITYADGNRTDISYDSYGNRIELTQAVGTDVERKIISTYDALDRVLTEQVTGADGVSIDGEVVYTYDAAGNYQSITDETGVSTQYTYDLLDRVRTVETEYSGLNEYIYDEFGSLTSIRDAEGHETVYEYDSVGRKIKETDAEQNETYFTYDVSNSLSSLTDGRGNTTTFTYDILNRRKTRTNPLGQVLVTNYDKRDNVVELIRETGQSETATYDALSRRVSIQTPDNVIQYTYAANGNLLSANDNDSAMNLTFDARNWLKSVQTVGGIGAQPETVLTYAYDALGQRKSVTDQSGATWAYAFDEYSQVDEITAPWGETFSMDYDKAGRRTELTSDTGRASNMVWENDRLASLSHFMSGAEFASHGYGYKVDGNVTLQRDELDLQQSQSFHYDMTDRLLQVDTGIPTSQGGVPIPTEDYAYDETGNRTTDHMSASYVIDDHNRLLSDSEYTYTYDDKGNRISRTSTADASTDTYTYDSMNQLIGVMTADGTQVDYTYDAFGRRIGKTINDGATTSTKGYVYDIAQLGDVTSHDIFLAYSDGELTQRWVHGAQTDEPLGFEAYTSDTSAGAGNTYGLHADRQGSIIAITEHATGTLAARYKYDAFGQQEVAFSRVDQPYGFTGRELDRETGLYHYRARTYDPARGRFLQSDPIGFAAGDTNLYAYTWNNPQNWTDPSGLTSSAEKSKLNKGVTILPAIAVAGVRKGVQCVAKYAATLITSILKNAAQGRDWMTEIAKGNIKTGKCRGMVRGKKKITCPICPTSKRSSFTAETMVATPDGPRAIETLREGDMVVARDQDTGTSGVFPVTALMGRTAPFVLWLNLEGPDGKVSRLGVTSEHPMRAYQGDWVDAGDLVVGDQIEDGNARAITVLSIDLDETPQVVHNLEIGGAHTYLVGELEAWGHNAWLGYWWKKGGGGKLQPYNTSNGQYACKWEPGMAAKMALGDAGSGFEKGWGGRGLPSKGSSVSNKCGYAAGAIARFMNKFGGG